MTPIEAILFTAAVLGAGIAIGWFARGEWVLYLFDRNRLRPPAKASWRAIAKAQKRQSKALRMAMPVVRVVRR